MGKNSSEKTLNKLQGMLMGLAIGDALGTTLEFKVPGTFEPISDMVGGGPFGLIPGHWTDDTSMALCLAESLVESNGFDPKDQMQRYLKWYKEGYYSPKGYCFDIGETTKTALRSFERTGDPYSGSTNPNSAGNGCIMRLAPVVIAYHKNEEQLIKYTGLSSKTTHGAEECIQCSIFLGLILKELLLGASKEEVLSLETMLGILSETANPSQNIIDIAFGLYKEKNPPEIEASGYVIKTLEAALWAFHNTSSFKDCVLKAVNLGNDADTVGAVAGQLAGAYYGYESIPQEWKVKIYLKDTILNLTDKLI